MLSRNTARRISATCRAAAFLGILFAAGAGAGEPRGDAARGAARAAACESCHGSPQRLPLAGMPSLAGQQEEFLVLQMFLFREGLRDVPQMAGVLNGLSDPDLADIAAYFTRRTSLPHNASRDPTLYARGAALSQTMGCGSCHLKDYRGQRQVPRLTQQREDYLVATMKAYRDSQRTGPDTNMNGLLYQVRDSDIQALAHYLAHQ
jgi:cytochrome c553